MIQLKKNNDIFIKNLTEEEIGSVEIKLWIKRINTRIYERSNDNIDNVIHDIIRGIFNKLICPEYCENKKIRKEITNWMKNIYRDARKDIWIYRCEQIKEEEKR